TEVKIVEQLKAQGIEKSDITREEFLVHAWAWKEKYGGRIVEQLKRLGCSCDWDRLAFTMDDNLSRAVNEVFVNLYNKGLIYRGSRIINYCPTCKTALSDAEVEYEEEAGNLWHINYAFKDGSGHVTVATTRPETMFGDTAVAVNPNDPRYAGLIGKTLILPIVNKEIPLVADEYCEMEFGTGAVKITPAHDPNDFNVGLRHNLEIVRVMNDDGTMNEHAGKFAGLDRYECRKQVVEELKNIGALEKIEAHVHNVGHCYRCHNSVEPIISKQWFVKMEPLAKPALKVVADKKIKFIPERFTKIYNNWMENIKDWCISRQLWWGHRIPAYYCENCGEVVVSKTMPTICPKCAHTAFRQDEDVLDTWFSSALWPFSTLGWPEKTKDLEYFYPTDLLVTAYDIIFFWVARMIFSGVEHMKRIPFKEVLIHGIVRDAQGRKMSKSLGNGIDPLEIIDEYGADTLRYSLVTGISAGNDTRFIKEKIEGCRNFINKIWNASRFVLMNVEGEVLPIEKCTLTIADKWILSKLNSTIRVVTQNMEKYELGNASGELQQFVWDDFCDWYIELSKTSLYGEDKVAKQNTVSVLVHVLTQTLKLLHPFIPYVTEEIWSSLPNVQGKLIRAD
ncbi:MAG: valine--tRNA ligase, partial [Clostridia bacterium]|nr:valine--tRNA ligase [Clostridia bacterium]